MSPHRESGGRAESRRASAGGGVLLANLAARPFVNKRPVQRFAMAAWAISAVLIGVNVALWLNYRHESTSLRTRLAATRAEIEAKSASVVEMDQKLSGLRLEAQNAQVAFLNERIAERTFPWSLLFERIASTLPDGVRLHSLSPVFAGGDESKSPSRRREAAEAPVAPEDEAIHLTLVGTAKSDDSLYELVDALFAAPAFASPRLQHESTDGGELEFAVEVDYRPRYLPEPSHRPSLAEDEEAAGDTDLSGIDEESSGTDDEPAAPDAEADADADAASTEGDEVSE